MEQVRITQTGEVKLLLPEGKEYKRYRTIGRINGNTYITERSENGIMRAFNGSIGLNYELMRDGEFTDVVIYFPSGRVLQTKRQTVLDYGKYLHFAKNNLERQIFLPLSDFNKSPKAQGALKHAPVVKEQESLFGGQYEAM